MVMFEFEIKINILLWCLQLSTLEKTEKTQLQPFLPCADGEKTSHFEFSSFVSSPLPRRPTHSWCWVYWICIVGHSKVIRNAQQHSQVEKVKENIFSASHLPSFSMQRHCLIAVYNLNQSSRSSSSSSWIGFFYSLLATLHRGYEH